jgi:hypothetical protein
VNRRLRGERCRAAARSGVWCDARAETEEVADNGF